MKKLFALLVLVLSICLVSGCNIGIQQDKVYGVDGATIYVGNTAGQEGALEKVGVPFNAGLKAALWAYNNAGGFKGAKVELINYSDGGIQANGIANTKKLVEEDEVLAMVGHFGSDVVAGTLDYLKDEEVPMVYAASGISALFNEAATGSDKYIMPIQPVYNGEGKALLARAVAKGELGLSGQKVGVIYTNDETGNGLLSGIKAEATKLGVTLTEARTELTGDHSTAVNVIAAANCDVIILATGVASSFTEILSYLVTGNVKNVKVISSYSNSAAALISGNLTLYVGLMGAGIEVYTSGWLSISVPYNAADPSAYLASYYVPAADNAVGQHILASYQAFDDTLGEAYKDLYTYGIGGFTAEYWQVAEVIAGYVLSENPDLQPGIASTAFLYSFDSYALAGYIAGSTIVAGLQKVEEQGLELTRANLVAAMEVGTVDIPMAGEVSFANGARTGVTSIAISKFDYDTAAYAIYSDLKSLEEVEAGYSK